MHEQDNLLGSVASFHQVQCNVVSRDCDNAMMSIIVIVWANSLFIHIEVNIIDDRTDISLELTTMQASCRATLMQQSRT